VDSREEKIGGERTQVGGECERGVVGLGS